MVSYVLGNMSVKHVAIKWLSRTVMKTSSVDINGCSVILKNYN